MKVSELKKALENIEEGEITVDGKQLSSIFNVTKQYGGTSTKTIVSMETLSQGNSYYDR